MTNWKHVLEVLAPERIARGEEPFTEEELNEAASWPTCACGVQDKRIPRERDGEPRDESLSNAGVVFYAAIDAQDLFRARRAMTQIELHSARVLREIEEEKK